MADATSEAPLTSVPVVASQLPALGAVSGNGGPTPGAVSTPQVEQNGRPKPVFKMKRTGFATLPQETPTRDRSAPSTPTPGTSHGPDAEPEPAKIVSDILPGIPSTPVLNTPAAPPKAHSASDGARKTKYATDEERRRATSIALKQRWASGLMDNVHKKRLETMRRRKEAESLLGTPGIAKSSPSVGSLKHTPKRPASPNRLPHLPGLAAPPAHEARKRSMVSEKLARLLNHQPVPIEPTTSPTRSEPGREKSHSASPPTSAISDAAMSEDNPEASHHGAFRKARAALPIPLNNGDDGDVDSEEEDGAWSSASSASNSDQTAEQANHENETKRVAEGTPSSIMMAASDRAYSKWRDETGSLGPTYGALIPEGYQLSTTIPGHPWICPVRSCRKVFAKLRELGGHFVRKHRGARLHDNDDGTLSERRIGPLRRWRNQVSAPLPAVIVSRGPADPSDLAAIAPSYPTSVPAEKQAADAQDLSLMEIDDDINPNTPSTTSRQGSDKVSTTDGDAGALWAYLQPHLVKYKGRDVPTQGWVPQLLTLPKVRDLDWNTAWLSTHPYNDTHPRDISALIIQVTGEPAPKPCERCSNGYGLFRSCIMMSAKANGDPLRAVVACANCFYHSGQTYCTHKVWGAERASRILNSGGESGLPDESPEEIRGERESGDDGSSDNADVNFTDDINLDFAIEDSNPGTSLTPGEVPASITEAEPGRPYSMWPDENGGLAPLFGSMLPSGYRLDTTIPGRPWVCPVRTCRNSHCKRSDLGFHFQRVHFAACLNDNCDGTFTIKGVYQDKAASLRKGGKILSKAPPIVVSKEPLASGSPIPKAQLPPYLAAQRPSLGLEEGAEQEVKRLRARIPPPKRGETAGLWTYIQQQLTSTTKMPSNTTVRHLLTLPKQRDVKYNTHRRRKPFIEKSSRDIAAMVIQVTGDEVSEMCKRCRQGKGPFEGCVIVPQTAHDDSRQRYPCCSNCLFGGKKLHCTLVRSIRPRNSLAANESFPAPGVSAQAKQVNGVGSQTVPRITRAAANDRKPTIQPSSTPASLSHPPAPSALISQGTFQSANDIFEMEDWEIAPGRIRETTTADPETIAFSKPYLSTTSTTPQAAVPVCDDVAFRVDTVQPGHALRLDADAGKTRLCSVAAGKVRVAIGAEAEFVVGPHGLFKVKAGVACTVRNGLYLDAVVHTVVLAGY